MLKIYGSKPNFVTIEGSGGKKVEMDVSNSPQFQNGLALFHTPEGATSHLCEHVTNLLNRYTQVKRGDDAWKKKEPVRA